MLGLFIISTFTACSDENGSEENTTDTETTITPSENSQRYFEQGLTFSSQAGNENIEFNCNSNWYVALANTTGSETWCKVSVTSGKAGNNTFTVAVTENTGYDDRNITLILSAGKIEKTIVLTQKQKDAILLTKNKFEVNIEGEKINIEVKANLDYTVEIDEFANSWIKTSNKTRALTAHNLWFDISPNEERSKREGKIYFKSGELLETVYIYQTEAKDIVLLSKNEYPVSDKGETIAVHIKSNLDFEVKMPNVEWIKTAPTRGMSSHTLYYVISPNETYDIRETEIIFYDKDNTNTADTLRIKQAQKDVIIISKKEYELSHNGGYIDVLLSTNVTYEQEISDIDAAWIKQIATRGLANKTLRFQILENEFSNPRTGTITIKSSNTKETVKVIQEGKIDIESEVTLNIDEAGTLPTLIPASYKFEITNLKLIGSLNGTDILYLREMAGSDYNSKKTDGKLQALDLSEANIVDGGATYLYYGNSRTQTNKIGENCFSGCTSLTSIIIPNSVTTIERSAFSQCTTLTSITIPYGVVNIGEGAFSGCTALTSITIPYSVISIGGSAFSGCTALTSAIIPNGVTNIEKYTFSNCTNLIFVVIPKSVTSVEEFAFKSCINLISVTFPNSVTDIGESIFRDCTNLTSVSFDGVINIKYETFYNCTSLISVSASSATSIVGGAFYNCKNLISVTIPSVTNIGSSAFSGCSSLKSIIIPNGVTNIKEGTFSGCTDLTSVSIPNSVTSIGGYAFRDCENLTSITISNNATSIGKWAFNGCSSLACITIPNSVTTIGEYAFYGCESLISITMPDNMTSIEKYAFRGCSSLASITIPNGIINIEEATFSECSSLKSIKFPDSIINIGKWAFHSCISLTSATIPNSVTNIGGYAFYYCKNLTSINIPENVTSIGEYAFSNSNLTSVTIPNSVTSIGAYAFGGLKEEVHIRCQNPPFIGSYAFPSTPTFKVYVPLGCKEIYFKIGLGGRYGNIFEEE